VSLQFFGDQRLPQQLERHNVENWFAYFTPSLDVQLLGPQGVPVPVVPGIPPNWAIFIVFDKPTKYHQAIPEYSMQQGAPLTEVRMASSKGLVLTTRGQIPACTLTIRTTKT